MRTPDTMIQSDKSKTGGRLPEALQFVTGFLVLALVMLGVGGTIYKLLAPGGWVAQLVGGNFTHAWALLLALGGVATFALATHDRISQRRRDLVGDWWVYVCAAAGLAYLGQILLRGGL